ncbi:MAG: type IV secretion system protein [Alphaproteobacteria bacterium]|nr:type IV secretion system protein [Alphaproteobacteria bacterium]
MAGGQQAENTLHENAIGWAILMAVLAVIVYIFWYFKAEEVRNIIRWIRYGEAWVLQWFIMLGEMIGISDGTFTFRGQSVSFWDVFNGNPDLVRQETGRAGNPNASLFYGMKNYNKNALTFDHLSLFNAMTVGIVKIVFVILTALAALWCLFSGPQTQYRSRLGLDGLIARQAKNFPVIAPFVNFNPSTQPPRPPGSPVPVELPDFAEALGPEEWLAYTQIPIPDGKIDEDAAAAEFKKQLVGRWKGPKGLKPYQQVLLAAFALKASRKRDASDEMLSRIAVCWSMKGGLNLNKDRTLVSEARKILRNKDLSAGTLAACNRHAFVTTALLRGLAYAREEGGVLAPAQFVWLRAHDRTLWYPMNNLGRHSFHMEALGAMSHYKAEKLTNRPIPAPKIEGAVQMITEYMASAVARPIPQLDYSQSTKRGVKKAV